MRNLDAAVIATYNSYESGLAGNVFTVDTTMVSANVAAVKSALNNLPASTALSQSQQAYYNMLNQLALEVANLQKAGATFNAGFPASTLGFAQGITGYAQDKVRTMSYQIFANLITNDAAGDTIRAAISESINTQKLAGIGIQVTNDPNPGLLLAMSQSKNIPLSTYISQNQ